MNEEYNLYSGNNGEGKLNGKKKGFFNTLRNLGKTIRSSNFLKKMRFYILVLSVLFIILILVANFFYYKDCPNEECFTDFMRDCSRAKFSVDREYNLQYNIEGISSDKCIINVKSLEGSTKGLDMECLVEKGEVYYPEENLTVCEGELKEEIE